MIPPNIVEQIKESALVEEVVGEYVTLKKRGANLLGLCPFHNEKTPSFTVSPAKGIYKCFGCGKAGNSISFVMEHEQFSFGESLRYLAEKYNIEIPKVVNEEVIAKQNERESYLIVTKFAQNYFKREMHETDLGKSVALGYFKSRGLLPQTIEKFDLGFTPSGSKKFTEDAQKVGYSTTALQALGLTSKNGYDFFRERIVFPIHNLSGKAIAFAGRTLKQDKKTPKYLNSPETAIYEKSRVLYGMHLAKNQIRRLDYCILVEGYMDVIALHQAGFENVVAISGTSFTSQQAKLIKRFSQNVVLLLDGDAAGQKATTKAWKLLWEEEMFVEVLQLPNGEDPDDLIQEKGVDYFRDYFEENRKDIFDIKAQLAKKELKNNPTKMSAFIKEMSDTLSILPDPIRRSLYVNKMAEMFHIEENILHREINKIKKKDFRNTAKKESEQQPIPTEIDFKHNKQKGKKGAQFSELDVLRVLISYGDHKINDEQSVVEYICEELEGFGFSDANHQRLFEICKVRLSNHETVNFDFFKFHENDLIRNEAIQMNDFKYSLSDNWEKMHEIYVKTPEENLKKDLRISLLYFKLQKITQMSRENQEKLKNYTELSEEELMTILSVETKIKEMRKAITDELGADILY